MTNELDLRITVEESTSIQWVYELPANPKMFIQQRGTSAIQTFFLSFFVLAC